MISFLRERVPTARITMSVCSGSWILARAGILDGLRATTNKAFFQEAVRQNDKVQWISEARWVEDGSIFTSSGISAGMDMSLAVIEALFGEKHARKIAIMTEYVWNNDPDNDPFHAYLNMLIPKKED